MNFLPGWSPLLAAPAAGPASFVFNATDEVLQRDISTSGASTTILTISMWIKKSEDEISFLLSSVAGPNSATQAIISSNREFVLRRITAGVFDWSELTAADQFLNDNNWHHYVFRYDSTQGASDNRIRLYRDGSLMADSAGSGGEPSSNESHAFFNNGNTVNLGNLDPTYHNKRLAFIDVLEGVSASPTDFAFDDGGTWTRMPYTGSYGTYGFSLDGTDGFNDVSGNGQHFTGVNMTVGGNLDTADLPPYTE